MSALECALNCRVTCAAGDADLVSVGWVIAVGAGTFTVKGGGVLDVAVSTIRGASIVTQPKATAGNSYRCQKNSILCSMKHATVPKATLPNPNGP